jgi:hypothetical protein
MAAPIVGVAPWSPTRLECGWRLVGALERRRCAPPATLDAAEVEVAEVAEVAVAAEVAEVAVAALRAEPESSPVQ